MNNPVFMYNAYEEKTCEWLQRMYSCWQEKAAWEEWEQELLTLWDLMKPDREELYLFVIGQLLALAAREEDMDTFIWLLEREEYPWFSLQSLDQERGMLWGDYLILREKLPWVSSGPFITEKEEYLNEIFRRYGISRIPVEEHYVMVDANYAARGGVPVRLPDPYIALISGNLHMAEYFRERGGYGRWGYIADDQKLSINVCDAFDFCFPQGRTWGVHYDDKRIDVLTAALLSRSYEMTEWVLGHFRDIPWGVRLARSIMWADRKATELILRHHPELPGLFSPGISWRAGM